MHEVYKALPSIELLVTPKSAMRSKKQQKLVLMLLSLMKFKHDLTKNLTFIGEPVLQKLGPE